MTTVAHHNPFYRELRRTMPVRVVRRYGWAHSFLLERQPAGARGEPGGDVAARWRATPADAPFFVHLAEGVDDEARGELPRLEALGCLKPNTVIVHGVAIDATAGAASRGAGAGLVWCPASNDFLFGRTRDASAPARRRRAPDARVHTSRSAPTRASPARATCSTSCGSPRAAAPRVRQPKLLRMVTSGPAALLRQPKSGHLTVGAPADLIVVPPFEPDPAAALLKTTRRDVRLVMRWRPAARRRSRSGVGLSGAR